MIFKFICALALISSVSFAAPYKPYDHAAMLKKDASGKQSIDIGGIFSAVDELWPHARQYPLAFDSQSDQERASSDLQTLDKAFAFLKEQGLAANLGEDARAYFELSQARIFTMEHNFDIAGAAQKADAAYKNLLAHRPNDGEIHAEFGDFLANSGRLSEAKNEFEAALKLGQKRSNMGLAMICLMQKDEICAKSYLQKYLDFYPNDKFAREILGAMEDGSLKIEEKR